jgi:hypothetical protein
MPAPTAVHRSNRRCLHAIPPLRSGQPPLSLAFTTNGAPSRKRAIPARDLAPLDREIARAKTHFRSLAFARARHRRRSRSWNPAQVPTEAAEGWRHLSREPQLLALRGIGEVSGWLCTYGVLRLTRPPEPPSGRIPGRAQRLTPAGWSPDATMGTAVKH